jgi:anti-sigma factor RsiW
MLDERIAELIQADVDGELTASERDELEAVLKQSAEARRFREEMLQVARLMAELPLVNPPPGLTRRILDRIELPSRTRWLVASTTWFRPASYGLALAAGVLIAVGIDQATPTGPADIQNLVGSMVRQGKELPQLATGRLDIGSPGVEGRVLLKALDDDAWAMEFAIDSAMPVELTVELAAAGLRFGGFANPSTGVEVIEVSGGEVRIMTEGYHQFAVFLRRSEGSQSVVQGIGIAMSKQGENIFQGSLEVASTDG